MFLISQDIAKQKGQTFFLREEAETDTVLSILTLYLLSENTILKQHFNYIHRHVHILFEVLLERVKWTRIRHNKSKQGVPHEEYYNMVVPNVAENSNKPSCYDSGWLEYLQPDMQIRLSNARGRTRTLLWALTGYALN